jgi:hypothetical protein
MWRRLREVTVLSAIEDPTPSPTHLRFNSRTLVSPHSPGIDWVSSPRVRLPCADSRESDAACAESDAMCARGHILYTIKFTYDFCNS